MLTVLLLSALTALATPATVLAAYMSPEEVLLNQELYMPPSVRDSQSRIDMQAQESAARREREQQRAFELQHPTPEPEPVPSDDLHGSAQALPAGAVYAYPIMLQPGAAGVSAQAFGAAPTGGLSDSANLELLRTMRLLNRVNTNQATSPMQNVLHSGADDLTPSGPGSILAAILMVGCVAYVLRRAQKSKAIAGAF